MKIVLNPWPFDGRRDFEKWKEEVFEALPFQFFLSHSAFIIEVHGVFDFWATKLFDRSRPAPEAAQIIARAYYFHRISNQFFN